MGSNFFSRSCFSALHVGAVRCLMTIVYDGEPFKVTRTFRTTLSSALQLQIYFELELCNPLKSKRQNTKSTKGPYD